MSRLDEFRVFVQKHPLLRDEVKSQNRTWQSIYEEWVLYGEGNDFWKAYEAPLQTQDTTPKPALFGADGVKSVINNIKKVNPENLKMSLSKSVGKSGIGYASRGGMKLTTSSLGKRENRI